MNCIAETDADAALERRWTTLRWTSKGGRKIELRLSPERTAEIEAAIAAGTVASRTLRGDGGIYHQYLRAES